MNKIVNSIPRRGGGGEGEKSRDTELRRILSISRLSLWAHCHLRKSFVPWWEIIRVASLGTLWPVLAGRGVCAARPEDDLWNFDEGWWPFSRCLLRVFLLALPGRESCLFHLPSWSSLGDFCRANTPIRYLIALSQTLAGVSQNHSPSLRPPASRGSSEGMYGFRLRNYFSRSCFYYWT